MRVVRTQVWNLRFKARQRAKDAKQSRLVKETSNNYLGSTKARRGRTTKALNIQATSSGDALFFSGYGYHMSYQSLKNFL